MLILLETKIKEHKSLSDALGLDTHVQVSAIGFSGGIAVMWKQDVLQLDNFSSSAQGIHVMVKVRPDHRSWLFLAIYASPDYHMHTQLWDELCDISNRYSGEWFMGGDFNDILEAKDKLGGTPINYNRVNAFRQCLNNCSMINLGFKGNKYTWTNKHHRNRRQLIFERLDRCLANNLGITYYPETTVTYLPRTKSDHSPMLVNFSGNKHHTQGKTFRFEPMWCTHHSFKNLVNSCFNTDQCLLKAIEFFQVKATHWNSTIFGNIFHKHKRVLARLDGIQNFKQELLSEYNSLLLCEENIWKMKSRISWIREGDTNTKIFHASTLNRKRRNKIYSLNDEADNSIQGSEEITNHFFNFFTTLYTLNHIISKRPKPHNSGPVHGLSVEASSLLASPLRDSEILSALKSFHSLKAPGPDGIHLFVSFRNFGIYSVKKSKPSVVKLFKKKRSPKNPTPPSSV
ncbi:uncharacterized protein LOC124897662 [Capsicum annuum]|uniref:uncharacterized protein LOC124897662 n=1 Tax=Capsicum annuum TaxID=4072 RepID=UPI001FB0F646|nr:uncharacterized protein LOC124897662 [Capsicum annuum]